MAERAPPYRLILASGSPARRELLTQAGYQFDVRPADIEEPRGDGFASARALVHYTAWLKAAAVAPTVEEGLVLAADSVSWIDGQAIFKPEDEADARRIHKLLAGREHELWTGVCLWRRPDDRQICWQEASRVRLCPLTDDEIDTYLRTRQWEGCAGAYAVQEGEDPYVAVTQGSVSNVIGLPMESLATVLQSGQVW